MVRSVGSTTRKMKSQEWKMFSNIILDFAFLPVPNLGATLHLIEWFKEQLLIIGKAEKNGDEMVKEVDKWRPYILKLEKLLQLEVRLATRQMERKRKERDSEGQFQLVDKLRERFKSIKENSLTYLNAPIEDIYENLEKLRESRLHFNEKNWFSKWISSQSYLDTVRDIFSSVQNSIKQINLGIQIISLESAQKDRQANNERFDQISDSLYRLETSSDSNSNVIWTMTKQVENMQQQLFRLSKDNKDLKQELRYWRFLPILLLFFLGFKSTKLSIDLYNL